MPLVEDLEEALRKDLEDAKIPIKGVIALNVIAARSVRKCDRNGSDPYCEIHFPDKTEVKTICSIHPYNIILREYFFKNKNKPV